MTDNTGQGEVTQLLQRHRSGDRVAFDQLVQILYPELHALAARRSRNAALSATTLLHETFASYIEGDGVDPRDRRELFALAATIMRRIVIDEARRATAAKRQAIAVTLVEAAVGDPAPSAETLLAIDQLLEGLNTYNQRLRQVFECRYFAGFTTAETADMLATSERTAERLWHEAKSWMAENMR